MNRLVNSVAAVTIAAAVALLLGADSSLAQAPAKATHGAIGGTYTPPRTPDGQPDISGMWQPGSSNSQPMETPSSGQPWHPPAGYRAPGAYDFGAQEQTEAEEATVGRVTTVDHKPMIFDPPNGKIPLQPWAAAKRAEIIANPNKAQFIDPRVRCLQSGVPRANLPVDYNSYQFIQKPGHVVLLYEWNHMTRVIPLDGRPHLDQKIRLALGDSRGRWEGNTLVVDVTNFTDETWVVGHGAPPEGALASALVTGHGAFNSLDLHVVERFTLVDANTIRYQATIEDPKVFTRPWSLSLIAFRRALPGHQLFEYACHEGNRDNMLLMTGLDIEAR